MSKEKRLKNIIMVLEDLHCETNGKDNREPEEHKDYIKPIDVSVDKILCIKLSKNNEETKDIEEGFKLEYTKCSNGVYGIIGGIYYSTNYNESFHNEERLSQEEYESIEYYYYGYVNYMKEYL